MQMALRDLKSMMRVVAVPLGFDTNRKSSATSGWRLASAIDVHQTSSFGTLTSIRALPTSVSSKQVIFCLSSGIWSVVGQT